MGAGVLAALLVIDCTDRGLARPFARCSCAPERRWAARLLRLRRLQAGDLYGGQPQRRGTGVQQLAAQLGGVLPGACGAHRPRIRLLSWTVAPRCWLRTHMGLVYRRRSCFSAPAASPLPQSATHLSPVSACRTEASRRRASTSASTGLDVAAGDWMLLRTCKRRVRHGGCFDAEAWPGGGADAPSGAAGPVAGPSSCSGCSCAVRPPEPMATSVASVKSSRAPPPGWLACGRAGPGAWRVRGKPGSPHSHRFMMGPRRHEGKLQPEHAHGVPGHDMERVPK